MNNDSSAVRCYPHCHMSAAQYGFWDVCRALAYKNDILFFNGRSIAARFKGMSKSTAYLLADALTEAGWFKLVKDSTRRKDGTFSPKQYRVLSHDEWAKDHPEGCSPVQPSGLDDISPVQPADSPVQWADQPVQPAGHNLIDIPTNNQPTTEPDNHRPFQPVGLDGFVQRFSKKRGRQRKSAVAPNLDRRPVQSAGQEVRDTQVEAERLSVAITNTLGLTKPENRTEWSAGLKAVLDQGYAPEVVSDVVAFTNLHFKSATMQQEGAKGFVSFFPQLHLAWRNAMQEPANQTKKGTE